MRGGLRGGAGEAGRLIGRCGGGRMKRCGGVQRTECGAGGGMDLR